MSAQKHRERLEVDEDPAHQQVEWKVERVAWVIWALIVAAGLLGLLGPGPFSSTEARSSDGQLRVEYDRITRRRADREIVVRIPAHLARNGEVRLRTSADFLEHEAIERIQPEPREVIRSGGDYVHVFAASAAADTVVITIRGSANRTGRREYVFGVEGGPEVKLHNFVLP